MRYRGRHRAPTPNPLAAPAAVGAAAAVLLGASPAHAGTHTVRRGETLSGIAARYGVTVGRVVALNGLKDPNLIVAGEILRIPGGGSAGRAAPRVHRVRSGENLSGIAAHYGVSVDALARANHLADPNLIVTGERLRIPRGGAAPVASTSSPVASVSSSGGVEAVLERNADDHGLDRSLVKAVAWQESGWHQNVVSSAGAIGVMQVMPDTADYVNESLGGGNLNAHRTRDNVELGVTYLDHVIDQMPTEDQGLAAYYTGPGNVGRKLTKIQEAYVRSVQALRGRF
ncbi:MAG: LysM peptidoglycan-binding domain-containing protein [Actinobacteria bacterium]|nr:LysM peptidoglycan-binding domain-containing protein [Actinomycetota bacterium]